MPPAVRRASCSMRPERVRLTWWRIAFAWSLMSLHSRLTSTRCARAPRLSRASPIVPAPHAQRLLTSTMAAVPAATSAPRLGPPLPHLHRDRAQFCTARARSLPSAAAAVRRASTRRSAAARRTRQARSCNSARHSRMNAYGRLTARPRSRGRAASRRQPRYLRQVSARAAQGLARRRRRRRCRSARHRAV